MGQGSRCFVLADPMQTDLRSENAQGGFEIFIEKLFLMKKALLWEFMDLDLHMKIS